MTLDKLSGASAIALLSAACATAGGEPTTFIQTPIASCPAPIQMVSEVRHLTPERGKSKKAGRKNARLASANIVDAATVYPWNDGQVYQVAVQVGRITTIRLQPGEVVPGEIAWLDKETWKFGKTQHGSEGGVVTTILVRATSPGRVTTAVIASDRRVYQLELLSYSAPAMDMVRWDYGAGGSDDFDNLMPPTQQRGPMTASLGGTYAGIDPTSVNRNYSVSVRSGHPRWTPISVADYGGTQVYIEFPDGLSAMPQPVLYDVSGGGLRGTIPYSVQGRFYKTHRSFTEAELRLGSDAVRISRTASR